MTGSLRRAAMALLTAATLAIAPCYAQAQDTSAAGAQTQAQPVTPASVPTEQAAPVPGRDLRLSLGPNYSNGKSWFPNIIAPYTPINVPEPPLMNTPRISQLIQNGQLMLSLEDAVSLALENNLDIAVQRFTPWLDEANLLFAKSGANGRLGFDPILTSSLYLEQSTTPVNNPFFAGTGTGSITTGPPEKTPAPAVFAHEAVYNFQYTQGFAPTGTQVQVTFDNTRQSSSLATNLFNPYVESTLSVLITQPLLNGFGRLPNMRYIIEAKNTVKVGESQFAQAIINDVTLVQTDYWELVYSIGNIKGLETTVAADKVLYDNNKKQLEIGTLAPLDVITAESQLATDQQALVQAQTTRLQDETKLLNDITKDPLSAGLIGIQIVPTTPISTPAIIENLPIQDAVHEAWQKRPELQQAALNLQNADVEVKVTRNYLLPQVNLFGEYQATGLGGIERKTQTNIVGTEAGSPIVNAGGVAIPGFFEPSPVTNITPFLFPGGLPDDWSRMINAQYPLFEGGVNITLPIRNRAAQANNATAQINRRLQETQYRQLQNTIFVAVRNAQIALVQDRAAIVAAEEARNLAQQSYDDEVKKFQLGTSTAFTVTQKQQLLTAAEGVELRDRANLIEAEVNFNQAMGRTLEVNNIIVDGTGPISRTPNIPGAPSPSSTPSK